MNFAARVTSRICKPRHIDSSKRPHRCARTHLGGIDRVVRLRPVCRLRRTSTLTAAEARRLIKQLETDAAAIDQQYAGVKEQIKQGRAIEAEAG